MKRLDLLAFIGMVISLLPQKVEACTGITLHTVKGETVTARTVEWAGDDLESRYTIVPRLYSQRSYVPDGTKTGMAFTAKYGYAGLSIQQAEFMIEGMNEAGLSAGLFYFPGYGEYVAYDKKTKDRTIGDLQLVSYILGSCKTINDVKAAIAKVRIVTVDPRGSTVHWRFTEAGGRQVVLEIIGKKPVFYENKLGVLTNSPSFDWHLTNLNNYVNLVTGRVSQRQIGSMNLTAFGGGSGLHGIPGDMTPPSRFVRAAFFQTSAPKCDSTKKAVEQAFHILNNFDIPIGTQYGNGQKIPNIPSATQWTAATDIKQLRLYYRTMHNATIRCIDLNTIDFGKVKFQSFPLDKKKTQPIEMIQVSVGA